MGWVPEEYAEYNIIYIMRSSMAIIYLTHPLGGAENGSDSGATPVIASLSREHNESALT